MRNFLVSQIFFIFFDFFCLCKGAGYNDHQVYSFTKVFASFSPNERLVMKSFTFIIHTAGLVSFRGDRQLLQ